MRSELVRALKRYDDYIDMSEDVAISDIERAEDILGVKFSQEYKDYTMEVGSAAADGHEFTGVVNSPRLNVVSVTQNARKKINNISEELYVIESLDIDGILIWQEKNGNVFESDYAGHINRIASSIREYIDSE